MTKRTDIKNKVFRTDRGNDMKKEEKGRGENTSVNPIGP